MEGIYLIIDFDGFNSKLHVILTVRWFTKSVKFDGEYFSSPVKYVLKCEIRPVGRQIPGLDGGTKGIYISVKQDYSQISRSREPCHISIR